MCKVTTTVALILLIIGGLNWGLVGIADIDLVAMLFGAGILAKIVYVAVGLSALFSLTLFKQLGLCCCASKEKSGSSCCASSAKTESACCSGEGKKSKNK